MIAALYNVHGRPLATATSLVHAYVPSKAVPVPAPDVVSWLAPEIRKCFPGHGLEDSAWGRFPKTWAGLQKPGQLRGSALLCLTQFFDFRLCSISHRPLRSLSKIQLLGILEVEALSLFFQGLYICWPVPP